MRAVKRRPTKPPSAQLPRPSTDDHDATDDSDLTLMILASQLWTLTRVLVLFSGDLGWHERPTKEFVHSLTDLIELAAEKSSALMILMQAA